MTQNRQLAAIMFTDIVGYTALMRRDEHIALEVLDKNRNVQKPLIEKHGGRFIKEIGDGILATFPTASEAVLAAKEIQQQLSGDADLKLRIGIHLGEIILADHDIFGDGVNIASRIENIAPACGIYISESVYNEVRNIPEIQTSFQGEIEFKNTDTKTKIYAIALESSELPGKGYFKQKKTEIARSGYRRKVQILVPLVILLLVAGFFIIRNVFPTESTPGFFFDQNHTMVILPFENLEDDTTQQHIVTGITTDIQNQLVKIKDIKVIDRSNLKRYQYQDKSYNQIGEELDVDNLVMGSISLERNGGRDQIYVTVKLVSTASEELVWSETYDEPYDDFLSIEEDIALAIAKALNISVTDEETKQIEKRATLNISAYELYLKGREYYSRYTEHDNISAMELYNDALQLDPDFILAHAGLSDAFSQMAQKSNMKDFWLDSAYYHAHIVLKEDPRNSSGHKSLGLYYSIKGNTEKAIEEFIKAIDIDKNIEAVINLSRLYYKTGHPDKAIAILTDAQWHNPINADLWFSFAESYYCLNEIQKSKEYIYRAITIDPNKINALLLDWLIAIIENDTETSFTLASKLGYLGNDDTDKLLVILQRVIHEKMTSTAEMANTLIPLLDNREIDYIDIPYIFNLIGYVYYKGGLVERAENLFDYKLQYNLDKINNGETSYKYHYEIAQIYGLLEDRDRCYDWLQSAIDHGWMEYPYAIMDPLLLHLNGEESFMNLMENAKDKTDSLQVLIKMSEFESS